MPTIMAMQTAPLVCERPSIALGGGSVTEVAGTVVPAKTNGHAAVGEVVAATSVAMPGTEEPEVLSERSGVPTRVKPRRRRLPRPFRISLDGGRRLVELPRGYKPTRWWTEEHDLETGERKLFYSTLWRQEEILPSERRAKGRLLKFQDKDGNFSRQSWRTWVNRLPGQSKREIKFLPAALPEPREQWFAVMADEVCRPNFPPAYSYEVPMFIGDREVGRKRKLAQWPAKLVMQPPRVQVHDPDEDIWSWARPDPNWLYVQLPYHFRVWDEMGRSKLRTSKPNEEWKLVNCGMWIPQWLLKPIKSDEARRLCRLLDGYMAFLDGLEDEALAIVQ